MSDTYERLCLNSLTVGTKVFPTGGVNKGPRRSAVVELVDVPNGRAILRAEDKHSRICTEKTLATRWEWLGKPAVPLPAPTETKSNGSVKGDNLSPMWQAIRRLEVEVSALKTALGVTES